MDDERCKQFCETLDQHHDWPCDYIFKFIVPKDSLPQLMALFDEKCVTTRESRTGKYVSLTAEQPMECSTDVAEVYRKASAIKDVVAL